MLLTLLPFLSQIVFHVILRQMPLYSNIEGRMIVCLLAQQHRSQFKSLHYLQRIFCWPLLLNWTTEVCSKGTGKRALIVAMANDLTNVVLAVVSHTLIPKICILGNMNRLQNLFGRLQTFLPQRVVMSGRLSCKFCAKLGFYWS